MAPTINAVAQPPDINQCEAEPIHIPGAIQPHGVLLVLQGPELRIVQATHNSRALLGVAVADLLDRELSTVLGPALGSSVRKALDGYLREREAPSTFRWHQCVGAPWFAGSAHWSGPSIILELESAAAEQPDLSQTFARAMGSFSTLRALTDLPTKLQTATALFRHLTGFDRVMVYRFDEDWHGEVVAEARRADLEPYLGLHYPASDIPAQARQVFLINPSRVIVDVDYVPSLLHPLLNPVSGQPLDLSRSLLRSVSPMHLEYLRNMGVASTLTMSLLREGRLWGLVACHHETPHSVPWEIRELACWMAQDLATQIALAEEVSSRRYDTHLMQCRDRIISAMRQGTRLPALLNGPELTNVLGAIGADGVALIRGEEVVTGGQTPDPARIRDVASGLSAQHPNNPSHLFATDCLSEHLADTGDLAATAAGVALFPLDAGQTIKLIWFRGEQLRQVNWGGNPDKAVDLAPDGRLSPRQSFAAWSQIVKLRSRRWTQEELESARKLGALIDIEWRKMVEEALRESEALLKDVLDSLTAHIAVLDGRGVISLVNAAWRRFGEQNGGGRDCLPGADYVAVCRRALSDKPDGIEAKTALRGIESVLDGTQDAFSLKYPCDSPGESRWFEMRAFPLRGSRPGAVIAHEDITGQKLAEAALKKSEELLRQAAEEALRLTRESFRLAVDNMPDALVIYDDQMRYSFLNAVSLQRGGLPLEAYLGRRDDEIHGQDVSDAYVTALRKTYETRASTTLECGLNLPTGYYDLVITFVPMLENGEVYQVFGLTYDVTERKRSEVKLAEQAQQLREADWRKDEFLAMLAHELRNPLAPISNAVQLLQRAGLDARIAWCLGVIERQTAHLTRLVDDLLDISRITRGIIELRMEPLNLANILSRAVETSRPVIDMRRHSFQMALPHEPVWVAGDLVRLTQVVSNLLTNAAKFTNEGGRIHLSAEDDGHDVVIRVRDSGRGIDPGTLSQLFDLFYQADRSIARSEGGLGIGLSLVKQLVTMHGGTAEVQSEGLGKGSEFTVRLPRLSEFPEWRERTVSPAGTAVATTPARGGPRILVVDDNRDAIDSLELLLGSEGYDVLAAYDGETALQLALTHQPRIVLLDIGLPEMDGYAVARALRRQIDAPTLRIIALTGYGQSESRRASEAAGFDMHVVKPVDFESLLKLLSEYSKLTEPSKDV